MLEYILVTPAKNEEIFLPKLIDSIVEQTVKPAAWFIIDDSSRDGTPRIIERAAAQYPWIHSLRSGIDVQYSSEEHLSVILSYAFRRAIGYCMENGIGYDYIAISDADTFHDKDYFYNVMGCFQKDEKLGIASGRIVIVNENGDRYEESKIAGENSYPYGTGRVWDKRCFEETGGIAISKAWDAVSNTMALIKGWKIRQLDYDSYQLRDTGGKSSLWNGYYRRGIKAHYLGINPLGILNKVVDMVLISREKRSIMKSCAYVLGYARALAAREERIDNAEVRAYMGSYKRVMGRYLSFAKQLVRGTNKNMRPDRQH